VRWPAGIGLLLPLLPPLLLLLLFLFTACACMCM
jgi:hypothetical protein